MGAPRVGLCDGVGGAVEVILVKNGKNQEWVISRNSKQNPPLDLLTRDAQKQRTVRRLSESHF